MGGVRGVEQKGRVILLLRVIEGVNMKKNTLCACMGGHNKHLICTIVNTLMNVERWWQECVREEKTRFSTGSWGLGGVARLWLLESLPRTAPSPHSPTGLSRVSTS